MEKFIPDSFFNHQIKISQPETGYRFSMDPILLAAHIKPNPGDVVLDIGCGCGIMPLILGSRYPDARIVGVEIQEELARYARTNIDENELEKKVQVLHRDVAAVRLAEIQGPADIIISNPPYKKRDTGRLNPDPRKALARHEITLDLPLLLSSARRLLKSEGTMTMIFPAQRLPDIMREMENNGFQLDWLRFIHIQIKEPARLVLASGIKNGNGPVTVRPPLILTHESGKPTEEYSRMFAEWDAV